MSGYDTKAASRPGPDKTLDLPLKIASEQFPQLYSQVCGNVPALKVKLQP